MPYRNPEDKCLLSTQPLRALRNNPERKDSPNKTLCTARAIKGDGEVGAIKHRLEMAITPGL